MFKKISLFFFFYYAIVGVHVIYLPKILSNFEYSSWQIGIIYSASPLIRFILPFIFKKYYKLNEKTLYISLFLLFLTALSFYVSIKIFWLFLIANIVFGACMGIILPYIESFSLEVLQKEKYGKARLFGSIGFILVTLTLARFLNNAYTALHFLFGSIILTIFFALIVANKNFAPAQSVKSSLSILKYARFWISLFLLQVSFGAFYNFFTIYETNNGFSIQIVSYMWTFGVICEVLFFYFQAPFLKKYSLVKLIKFSCFLTSIRWLILYLFPSSLFLTFFSQSFHAISFALLHSAAFSYLHVIYPKEKALASQFYYGLSYGLGGFLGSIISGATYGKYVYLFASLLAFLAFLFARSKDYSHV